MFAIRNEQTNRKHEWIFYLTTLLWVCVCTIVYMGHLLNIFLNIAINYNCSSLTTAIMAPLCVCSVSNVFVCSFVVFFSSFLFLSGSCTFIVCGSKDIRNAVKNLNELRGCRVIEGFLMITLIDKYNETDYDGMEFPELTEVTDFVLLYRVNGLKSVGKLFPKLRIIRGNNLVHDFSFVVFEMMHLQVKLLGKLFQWHTHHWFIFIVHRKSVWNHSWKSFAVQYESKRIRHCALWKPSIGR